MERDASRKRIFVVLACFGAVILLTNLALITGTDFGLRIEKLQMPEMLGGKPKGSMDFSDTVGLPSFFYILLLLLLLLLLLQGVEREVWGILDIMQLSI